MMTPQPLAIAPGETSARRNTWLVSWPLIVGALVYLFVLSQATRLLKDGDTYWHIAAGKWILEHGTVPSQDPFSHTMSGALWTAQSWLAEVVMAVAHDAAGWDGVVAVTALMFAGAIALLTRALLASLAPIYALLFTALAVALTAGHLLARPHILIMPLMLLWTIELAAASDSGRPPRWRLLPIMTLWANMHGGFTLGLLLTLAFATEAIISPPSHSFNSKKKGSWVIFLFLAMAASLLTPHGAQGILYTWQTFTESNYSLTQIGEWKSPSFQKISPLEIWLLAGLAMFLHQGLRLPIFRLAILLGLLHLALKHARAIEFLGLLTPLILAKPLAEQWAERIQKLAPPNVLDRTFDKLAGQAGIGALSLVLVCLLLLTHWSSTANPARPPTTSAPTEALDAVREAGIRGPVFNEYGWGGYLIYSGIAPFIDGRSDMYGEKFLRKYLDATRLKTSNGLENILNEYNIHWTLLRTGSASATLLNHLPNWRILYADDIAIVHVRRDVTEDRTLAPKNP